jgi:hypothetical protein
MGIQRWVGKHLEINAFRFRIGVYNVQYTNVGALIIGKGVGHFKIVVGVGIIKCFNERTNLGQTCKHV